jgi:hypothetical protein
MKTKPAKVYKDLRVFIGLIFMSSPTNVYKMILKPMKRAFMGCLDLKVTFSAKGMVLKNVH